jgi:hypothetical protein
MLPALTPVKVSHPYIKQLSLDELLVDFVVDTVEVV